MPTWAVVMVLICAVLILAGGVCMFVWADPDDDYPRDWR